MVSGSAITRSILVWWRNPAGAWLTGADSFSAKVEAVSPDDIESLRRGPAGEARELLQLGLLHPLSHMWKLDHDHTLIQFTVSFAERLTVWDASEFADRVGMIFAFYDFTCVARSLK
jgi:hypothetical protein